MGNIILKPSTFAYDGMNSIEEILGEYNAYLKLLPYNELKREFTEDSLRKFLVKELVREKKNPETA